MVTLTPVICLVILGVCQRVNSQGATLAELLAGTGAVQPVGQQSQYVPPDNQAQGIDGEDPDIDKLIDSVFNNNKVTTEQTKQPVVSVTPNINAGGNGDCECVPFYLCKNNTIVQDGEGLLDIRSGFCKFVFGRKRFCYGYVVVNPVFRRTHRIRALIHLKAMLSNLFYLSFHDTDFRVSRFNTSR